MKEDLRNKYREFIYDSYNVNYNELGIEITYKYLISNYVFTPKAFISNEYISNKNYDKDFLDVLFFNFGIINAISYYKLTCSKRFIIKCGYLDKNQKEFFKKLFYNGLGEFLYVNKLNISYDDLFYIETTNEKKNVSVLDDDFSGNLIPIGGGKDSIVTIETLKDYDNLCFLYKRNIYPDDQASLNTIKLSNNKFVSFDITLDSLMLELNKKGFYNGHIPFSSCLAFASFILAYLNNKKYIVLSNEASANEGNIKDSNINHQYSKSYEFEKDFREYTKKYFTDKIEYFSLLRGLNEYQIVKRFLENPKYLDVFRSCNIGSKTNTWCGNCSKCLYVYIMLYPFVDNKKLIQIFGNNMLNNKDNLKYFLGLILEDEKKPFECVGTKEEINYCLTLGLKNKKDRPYLLDLYEKEYYKKDKKYNIENYYNDENFIPSKYKSLIKR